MSDVSKTNELIVKANTVSTNDVVADPRRYRGMIHELADALEAATRVPVQGEPNDDREAEFDLILRNKLANRICEVSVGYSPMLDEAAADIANQILADAELMTALSRATVPDAATDARDHLHAMCDCAPNLGPAHCHLCSKEAGRPIDWVECNAVTQTVADNSTVELTQAKSDMKTMAEVSRATFDKLKAERDAATERAACAEAEVESLKAALDGREASPQEWNLMERLEAATAAIERVRVAVEAHKHWNDDCGWDVPAIEVFAALDGAPEPEVKP